VNASPQWRHVLLLDGACEVEVIGFGGVRFSLNETAKSADSGKPKRYEGRSNRRGQDYRANEEIIERETWRYAPNCNCVLCLGNAND